jgi:rhodanese-related sulfurtransferase
MKYITLVLLVSLQFVVITSCSSAQNEAKHTSSATKEQNNGSNEAQAQSGIDFANAVFVDVRTPGEFQGGTFKNATNIPVNELSSRLNELDKADQIVVFCRSGARASSAKNILESNGFTNVVNGINTANLQSLNK